MNAQIYQDQNMSYYSFNTLTGQYVTVLSEQDTIEIDVFPQTGFSALESYSLITTDVTENFIALDFPLCPLADFHNASIAAICTFPLTSGFQSTYFINI